MNDFFHSIGSWFQGLATGDSRTLLFSGAALCAALIIIARIFFRSRARRTVTQEPIHDDTSGAFGSMTEALAKQLPESKKEKRDFSQLLKQAGLYSPTARISIYAFRFVLLLLPLIVAGIIIILSPQQHTFRILILGVVAAGTLSIIPRFYVLLRRGKRLHEIRTGLADMMDMLSMCLGGGMPLSPSLEHVATNLASYPALAEELNIVKRQAELGSLKIALADFSNRIDIPEVRQVASLLSRGEQLGTQLSESLHEQADHFRSTRRQVATMHSNRMPVFLTLPLMFCFAPAVLVLLMSPAMLELTDFLNPRDQNVLSGNNSLSSSEITRTLDELDQTPNP